MGYLQENTTEALEMQKNLLDLLATHESANVELGLQLIESGGMLPIFVLPLWSNYYMVSVETQLKIRKNINKILPANISKIIFEGSLRGFYDIKNEKAIQIFENLCGGDTPLCVWDDVIEWIFPKLIDRMDIYEYFITKENINTTKTIEKMISDGYISFAYSNLEVLPVELFSFHSLKTINLEYSKISQMSDLFFDLVNLEKFIYDKTPLKKNRKFNKSLKEKKPKLVAESLYNLAKYDYFGGRYKKAAKNIAKCVKTDPESGEFWSWYGEIHRTADLFKEAENGFKKSLEIDPNNSFAYVKLAEVICNLGRYEETVDSCDIFLKKNQINQSNDLESDAWFSKGLGLFYLKRYEESLVCNDKAIRLTNYAGAWYNKACAYSKMNLKKEMLIHLRKSFDLDYDDYYSLASKDEDKDFDGFYKDEDFKALMKEYKDLYKRSYR